MSSAHAVASYLKQHNFNKTAYVIGMSGLEDELDALDISHIGGTQESLKVDKMSDLDDLHQVDQIGAVVFGFDLHINYRKLAQGYTYLTKKDTLFIATNEDSTYPMKDGKCFPGTGALVSCLKTAIPDKELIVL